MPILYPANLDALTNPTASDTLAGVPHDQQHSDVNDAVEALETKLGTGISTPATPGNVLRVTGPGATSFGAIEEGDLPSTVVLESELSTLATDAEVAAVVDAHAVAVDPHLGYQKESEKGAASGYASLDGSTKVPIAQVPTGTTSSTVSLGNHAHIPQASIASSTGGSAIGTSWADADSTNLTVVMTTGARRCRVTFEGSLYFEVNTEIFLDLDIDGSRQGHAAYGLTRHQMPVAGWQRVGFEFLTSVLSAASHTFKVKVCYGVAAPGTTLGYADARARLIVVEQGA